MTDPWQDGLSNTEHLETCPGCVERCDYLLNGFYMFCDDCGHAGHQDSDGWMLFDGVPVCTSCGEKREREGQVAA